MADKANSIFQRIRNARNSLENAEKSFADDKSIRGELDLMLAEAELQNLRRKKTFPWSWSRQTFALGVACLLALAGVGGWVFAQRASVEAPKSTVTEVKTETAKPEIKQEITAGASVKVQPKDVIPDKKETTDNKEMSSPAVSQKEMRKLVHSARVELNSSK